MYIVQGLLDMTILAISYFLKVRPSICLAWPRLQVLMCFATAQLEPIRLAVPNDHPAVQDGLKMQPARAGLWIAMGKGPW